MIKDQSFDTNVSINSDEEIKQIKIHPFDPYFQYYHQDNTQINAQNEKANSPAPSPKYKFMGASYSNDESTQSQSMQTNLDLGKLQEQCISQCTIDVLKSVDAYLDIRSKQDNYHVEIVSMQLIKMNMLKNKNVVHHNHHIHQTKTRNNKNSTANVRSLSPQGILKKSSFEGPFNKNLLNLQYNQNSNKKVSFEFTKEQIRSMKRINVSSVLINKKSRLFLN
ncbi:unnamed protein product (macronuclear) [Paramecium tetraurelia]|uniref:Uncharacterized protein n=1 Tax=Paramecium tetraurelia TaxID=5888 RepID=A0C498_PARTE|nr:uncharacterized protein GSPATT00035095001 [Paramecium tetraurelia]CAK65615.1 unnamed protein product [Paramecium tetraurelia]|eukprot:XP_001433012.1 hypothetical protein (macronuclear) [Paramecium tetraurelia strain d4-2]